MSESQIKKAKKEEQERKLDQALEDSFPGSDAIALTEPAPDQSKKDKDRPAKE